MFVTLPLRCHTAPYESGVVDVVRFSREAGDGTTASRSKRLVRASLFAQRRKIQQGDRSLVATGQQVLFPCRFSLLRTCLAWQMVRIPVDRYSRSTLGVPSRMNVGQLRVPPWLGRCTRLG